MICMRFRMLGRLEVVAAGGVVPLPGAFARAILGRLLLVGGDVVPRDDLIDDIWEQRATKDPVNALQVQVAKLRGAFAAKGEEGRLLFRHDGYQIVLEPRDEFDVVIFEAAVWQGRQHLAAGEYEQGERMLRQGLSQWRGRALQDVAGRVFQGERSRLEDLRSSALEDAAAAAVELGRAEDVIGELKTLVSREPLRERSRARLMLALYRSGRPAEALEVFEAGRRILGFELGADPSPELRDLHTAILRHDVPVQGPAVSATWPRPLEAAPNPTAIRGNLVQPLGAFIGRRTELEALCALADRERLVTVLGPGGVGKTRLALEACVRLGRSCDAAWWVDLASADDEAVVGAIAAALGLSDTAVRPDQGPHDYIHRLTTFLAGRNSLLALDNCEHLLDALAPVVATLLRACPELTVVTTSRAPLEIAGEALFPLAPMSDEEAAELFNARAVLADPSFTADEASARDIRSLCRRLDGLPLAVELAAAQVRMLSVRDIEARLDNRFALLSRGDRTAPARHRTLRAVLDWSYALLEESERNMLMELAMYVGGSSLAAAEKLGPPTAGQEADALAVLGGLVDKSLLIAVSTPFGKRLRMLETVREYAIVRLRESGAAPEAEARFMAWAAAFVREASEGIASGDRQGWWIRRVTEESANLRAASDLMMSRSRTEESLVLEARLGYYWFISGREEEGIARLRRSLQAYDAAEGQRPAPAGDEEEWALLYTVAWLAWLNYASGRYADAGSFLGRHEAVWHHANSPLLSVLGPCYDTLHAMLNGREELDGLFEAAEAVVAETSLHWERAVVHTNWSIYSLRRGNVEAARRHSLTAVSASQAAHDDFARAWSLNRCGDADESGGLHASARRRWNEAASIYAALGARTRWAYALLRLAFLDVAEGEPVAAEQRLGEVQRLADELSVEDLHAAAINLRAALACGDGRLAEAWAGFGRVWRCVSAPLDRRAVAGVGLAMLGEVGDPGNQEEERVSVDELRRLQAKLLEPLVRTAVGELIDRLEIRQTAADAPDVAPETERWLLTSPSVLAAFC